MQNNELYSNVNIKKISIFVLVLFILFEPVLISDIEEEHSQDVPNPSFLFHSPIYLVGDLSLEEFCSGNGTDGSISNPHIIEFFEIDVIDTGLGIYLEDISQYLIIRECKIINSGPQNEGINTGIEIVNCTGININNCIFERNSFGIYLENSNNNTFGKIKSTDNEICSIFLNKSSNFNLIFENNFSKNWGNGIHISNSDNNSILNNTLSYNDNMGIALFHSNGNIIKNNNITNNHGDGIYLNNSNNNTIQNNLLLYNYGNCIYEKDCENNLISDNTCIESPNQPTYVVDAIGYDINYIAPIILIVSLFIVLKLRKKK